MLGSSVALAREVTNLESAESDSQSDFGEEPKTSQRAKRIAAVALSSTALVAVLGCAAFFRASKLPDQARADGFIGASSVGKFELPPLIKPKNYACDNAIVLDVCLRAAAKEPSYYAGNPSSPNAVITAEGLAHLLMVSKSSVLGFLSKVGLSSTVSCAALCDKTMDYFSPHFHGYVDVACHSVPTSPCETISSDPLGSLLPSLFLTGLKYGCMDVSIPVLKHDMFTSFPGTFYLKGETYPIGHPNVTTNYMSVAVARLFRTHPAALNTFEITGGQSTSPVVTDAPSDSCIYSNDGQCDEYKYCPVGTDCTDCARCGTPGASAPLLYGTPKDTAFSAFAKAQTIFSQALLTLSSGNIASSSVLETLFGSSSPELKTTVRKVINKAAWALDLTKFVYPGPDCSPTTAAYIEATKTGTYVMSLCKAFMDGTDSQKFATIVGTAISAISAKSTTTPIYNLTSIKNAGSVCSFRGMDDSVGCVGGCKLGGLDDCISNTPTMAVAAIWLALDP